MSEPAKETVIIVHGTWAAPDLAKRKWYQPVDSRSGEEPFTAKLDSALRQRGSLARCWAHSVDGNSIFHWSGENSWTARTHAAAALGDYVATLQSQGWHCHIVAHSHGGNVLVEALPQLMAAPDSKKLLGRLVTLGTPFIDTMSAILQRTNRRSRLLSIGSWTALSLLFVLFLFILINSAPVPQETRDYISEFTSSILELTGPLLIILVIILYRRRTDRQSIATISGSGPTKPKLLAIGSLADEAWQILHHLRSVENPLAIKLNPVAYLLLYLRSASSQGAMIARIHGAKSYRDLRPFVRLVAAALDLMLSLVFLTISFMLMRFDADGMDIALATLVLAFLLSLCFATFFGEVFFSAVWSPFRWCARQVGSLASIFPAMATYWLRYSGWSTLLKIIMGLEGYQFKIPLIQQCPGGFAKEFAKYENMPSGAEQRALDKRSAWITRHLGDVSQTFSKLAVTVNDIALLLRAVEADQSLVHAAYYTDEECIAQIAGWIAGTETSD